MSQAQINHVVATSKRLAEMDPHDDAVGRVVQNLQSQISLLKEQAKDDRGWGQKSMQDDVANMEAQIRKLKSAAVIPAKNYRRILNIIEGLEKANRLASKPQNVKMRPRVVECIKKVAGIFAEVDTVEDLDKPLEQIEKAVHSLYGDQGKNDLWYFERRNKGHHKSD